MYTVIQRMAEFPTYLQVSLGMWLFLLVFSALAFVTSFCAWWSFTTSVGRDELEGESMAGYAWTSFAGFIWSLLGIGITYFAGTII